MADQITQTGRRNDTEEAKILIKKNLNRLDRAALIFQDVATDIVFIDIESAEVMEVLDLLDSLYEQTRRAETRIAGLVSD